MKRITLKQVAEAYRVMKSRGWGPTAGKYCNKKDKQVCPVAALAFSSLKVLPHGLRLENYDCEAAVERKFGVSPGYVEGIVAGVDWTHSIKDGDGDFIAGFELGRKCHARFIAK